MENACASLIPAQSKRESEWMYLPTITVHLRDMVPLLRGIMGGRPKNEDMVGAGKSARYGDRQ